MPAGYGPRDVERLVAEPAKAHPGGAGRTPFQRDRARVLHAAALRRLAGKTQVVGAGEDDFPRTRLTHSLECAQIGRELALELGADADLVDAACLAHDLGHPPFGHTGEQALAALADDCGGFEGNAQSLRLLTRLEIKVPGAGLNLTRATLDAACKYPWPRQPGRTKFGVYDEDLPVFDWIRQPAPGQRRALEAQIMDWADDVAYSVHDVEDGLHARQVDPAGLDAQVLAELAVAEYLPGADAGELAGIWTELTAEPWWVSSYAGGAGDQVRLKTMTSELIGRFCAAALAATREASGAGPLTRYAADLVVPWKVRAESALLKVVAVQEVMRRPRRLAMQARQRGLVTELVGAVLAGGAAVLDPLLRPAWEQAGGDAARLRVAVDQVAALTDASAVSWHRRLVRAG